jgi:hypothetical protein
MEGFKIGRKLKIEGNWGIITILVKTICEFCESAF